MTPAVPAKPARGWPGNIFTAKKALGQNFLTDRRVVDRMVDACRFDPGESVLEIGPGQGILTRQIVPLVRHVTAVEADGELAQALQAEFPSERVSVVHADFLRYDLKDIPAGTRVVGNIPYYISTPIINRILEFREKFTEVYTTLQLEFGQRLMAHPGSKDYSSLTCAVNYFTEPKMMFEISNMAFRPSPKVRSCFMRLMIRRTPAVAVRDEALFLDIIRRAFLQRRKTLLNALAYLGSRERLEAAMKAAGIAPSVRAETLELQQFAALSDRLSGQ